VSVEAAGQPLEAGARVQNFGLPAAGGGGDCSGDRSPWRRPTRQCRYGEMGRKAQCRACLTLFFLLLRYEAVRYGGQGVTHQSIQINHILFKSMVIKN
jgi:hypothetical protein